MSYLFTLEEKLNAGDLVQKLEAKHLFNDNNNYSFIRPNLLKYNKNDYYEIKIKKSIQHFDNIIKEIKKKGICIFKKNKDDRWISIYSYEKNEIYEQNEIGTMLFNLYKMTF